MKEANVKENHVLECGCGHCGNHSCNEKINNERTYLRENFFIISQILLSCSLIVLSVIFKESTLLSFCLSISAFIVIGLRLFLNVLTGIFHKTILSENFLMILASVVAFVLGEYLEGVLVLILFTFGEMLEDYATKKARKNIGGLSKLKVRVVRLITKDGVCVVSPDKVESGSLIEVMKGEQIPIDGVLIDSNAYLDMKALTGESNYISKKCGEEILSGAINVGDSIIIKTTKNYNDSTIEKIISMVEGAASKKAKSQKFISSFAKIYTPIVIILGLFIAFLPPLFDQMNFNKWIYKSLSFIVISCPCALVISVPMSFFIGLGAFARNGILIKGSNYIDIISKLDVLYFDKTGTLTEGTPTVEQILTSDGYTKDEVLKYAILLEKHSSHPLANAICKYQNDCDLYSVENIKEITGKGMIGEVNGCKILVGNSKLLNEYGIKIIYSDLSKTCVFVCVNGINIGAITFEDKIKEDAKNIANKLEKIGIKEISILSGDNDEIVKKVAYELNIKNYHSELLPQDKLNLISEQKTKKNVVGFVGDGINDAPALSLSDVGIAMGGLGSDQAIESADVIIMDDKLNKLVKIKKHSKKIHNIVFQNIFFSILTKVSIMILSMFTALPVWLAMFADVGVMTIALLNSIRAGFIKK
ncbi:MAG: cadmium-translocating P-type ATPase [Clostridia bacterium]|nr:cadmium-translocating P-type ATPase [Clostridia bacterium]